MASMTMTTQQLEPSSQGNNNDLAEPQLKAAKDRECPFCKVSFTSSSLGRHLDLYIREKNPKPPDGIHDVEHIRKLRRGITRRHARTSKGAQQARSKSGSSNGGDAEQSSFAEATRQDRANSDAARNKATSPLSPSTNGPLREPTNDPIKTYLNKASWQATGVINGLPPYMRDGGGGAAAAPTPSSTTSNTAPQLPPHQQLNFDFITRQKLAEESEARQAAEHALREILDGIHAADTRLRKEPLWDFDFFAQNWCGLCLRLLQPNPLIFSATPKSGAHNRGTWSIGPPKDIPNLWLADVVVKQFRKKGRALTVDEEDVVSDKPCPPDGKYTAEVNRHSAHIMAREIDWVAMPDERKEEVWRLEVLRYCAEQRRKCEDSEQRIEQITAEAARLKWELDALRALVGSHRSPGAAFEARAYVEPRVSTTTDVNVIRDLEKNGTNLKEWEFEQLTAKWTQAVRGGKKRASTAAANTYNNQGATVTISGGGEAMTLGPPSSSMLQTYAFSNLNGPGLPGQAAGGYQQQQQQKQQGTSGVQRDDEDNENDIDDDDDEDNEDQGSDVDMADEDEEEEDDDDDDEPD